VLLGTWFGLDSPLVSLGNVCERGKREGSEWEQWEEEGGEEESSGTE
jgi:hypothetical protein